MRAAPAARSSVAMPADLEHLAAAFGATSANSRRRVGPTASDPRCAESRPRARQRPPPPSWRAQPSHGRRARFEPTGPTVAAAVTRTERLGRALPVPSAGPSEDQSVPAGVPRPDLPCRGIRRSRARAASTASAREPARRSGSRPGVRPPARAGGIATSPSRGTRSPSGLRSVGVPLTTISHSSFAWCVGGQSRSPGSSRTGCRR